MQRIYRHGKLYSALIGMILIGTIDSVLYVRLTHKMEHYEWFLSQVAMTIGFLVVITPIVFYRMFIGRQITKEMRTFPKRVFFVIAGLDALSTLIGTIPSPYLPGPFIGVFGESHIPFTFLGSMLYLGVRYTLLHWLAAILMISGLIVNVIPFIQDEGIQSTHLFWGGLIMLSMIPMVCSSLYKEKKLKQWSMDVWYFNAWVAFFQLFVGLTTIWSELIPFPSPATHINPMKADKYIIEAAMCFVNMDKEDICGGTSVIFAIFIIFNVLTNVLVLYVYKRGSVTMAIISGTSILVLSNLAFHIKPLAGEAYTSNFSSFNLIALWIMACGIVLYNINDEIRPDSEKTPVIKLDEERGLRDDEIELDVKEIDGSDVIKPIRMEPLDSSDADSMPEKSEEEDPYGNPFEYENKKLIPDNKKKKKKNKGKERADDDDDFGIEMMLIPSKTKEE